MDTCGCLEASSCLTRGGVRGHAAVNVLGRLFLKFFSDLYNRIIEKLTKKEHLELIRMLVRIKNSIGKMLKD